MFLQDNVTIFVIIINKNEGIKKRWKIESNFQLVLLFIVCYNWFYIGPVIKACMWLGIIEEDFGYWFTPVRLLIPLYQVLLVLIGSLLGNLNSFGHLRKDAKKYGVGFL
jgi:hypothetical protein